LGEEAVNNSLTTSNLPTAAKGELVRQEQWEEFRSVFPIYLALAKQLEFEIPFGPDRRALPAKADEHSIPRYVRCIRPREGQS